MLGAENQPISENNKNTIVVIHKDINPSRPIINKGSFFFVRTTLIALKVTINIVAITKRGTMMIFIFKYNVELSGAFTRPVEAGFSPERT